MAIHGIGSDLIRVARLAAVLERVEVLDDLATHRLHDVVRRLTLEHEVTGPNARRIFPIHTPIDGDVLFGLATGRRDAGELVALFALAEIVAASAVERAVRHSTSSLLPTASRMGACA